MRGGGQIRTENPTRSNLFLKKFKVLKGEGGGSHFLLETERLPCESLFQREKNCFFFCISEAQTKPGQTPGISLAPQRMLSRTVLLIEPKD